MSKPTPQAIVSELEWIFLYADPNPLFKDAAETIKELFIENERLRRGHTFELPEREWGKTAVWGD